MTWEAWGIQSSTSVYSFYVCTHIHNPVKASNNHKQVVRRQLRDMTAYLPPSSATPPNTYTRLFISDCTCTLLCKLNSPLTELSHVYLPRTLRVLRICLQVNQFNSQSQVFVRIHICVYMCVWVDSDQIHIHTRVHAVYMRVRYVNYITGGINRSTEAEKKSASLYLPGANLLSGNRRNWVVALTTRIMCI